jgi:hypothetical protein
MRARGVALLKALHEQGDVIWQNGVPRLVDHPKVDAGVALMLRRDRQTIQAILRRAAVFAEQLAIASPDPFVRLRDPKWTAEGCPSCGGPIREHELRCELCSLAAALALEGTR